MEKNHRQKVNLMNIARYQASDKWKMVVWLSTNDDCSRDNDVETVNLMVWKSLSACLKLKHSLLEHTFRSELHNYSDSLLKSLQLQSKFQFFTSERIAWLMQSKFFVQFIKCPRFCVTQTNYKHFIVDVCV